MTANDKQALSLNLLVLKSSQMEVASKPKATPWGVRAVVRDPDGRTVELCETLDG